jgi:hypothetical protein
VNSEFKIDFFCIIMTNSEHKRSDFFWHVGLILWNNKELTGVIWYFELQKIAPGSIYHMVLTIFTRYIINPHLTSSDIFQNLSIQNIPPCSGMYHRKINWKPSHFLLWALGLWKVLAMTLLLPDSTKPNLFIFLHSIFHLFQPYFGISKNFTRK